MFPPTRPMDSCISPGMDRSGQGVMFARLTDQALAIFQRCNSSCKGRPTDQSAAMSTEETVMTVIYLYYCH